MGCPNQSTPNPGRLSESSSSFNKSLSAGSANLEHLVLAEQPRGPQLQERRPFLRSLWPTWEPRWAAFTSPLNCPCSFTFFLRLSLVLLRGM